MADEDETADDHYRVGYARPPKQHQFQRGRSGNPSGRPKGARNVRTIAAEVFGELVRLRREGSVVEVPMAEAILRTRPPRRRRAMSPPFARSSRTSPLQV